MSTNRQKKTTRVKATIRYREPAPAQPPTRVTAAPETARQAALATIAQETLAGFADAVRHHRRSMGASQAQALLRLFGDDHERLEKWLADHPAAAATFRSLPFEPEPAAPVMRRMTAHEFARAHGRWPRPGESDFTEDLAGAADDALAALDAQEDWATELGMARRAARDSGYGLRFHWIP
jgi:hypothetical protein